jgi:hypothetical protein
MHGKTKREHLDIANFAALGTALVPFTSSAK